MSHFDQVKRDPWMTEQHYKASTAAKEAEFADRDISDLLTDPLRVARHNKGLSWDHAVECERRQGGVEPHAFGALLSRARSGIIQAIQRQLRRWQGGGLSD